MIITVDGPAAAGKGTLSQKLAEKYCLAYFDTGMVYRAVGLLMLQNGNDLADATAAEQEKNYYQNQCQLMQNAVEDTRRFHHDISNHFSIVETFLEDHKTNEASQYLQELIQKEEKKSVLYSTCLLYTSDAADE